MRHGRKRLQLNRFTSWHKATLNSLLRSLLIYQSIKTTKQRAFAAKPLADKLISLGKENSLTAKRRAFRILGDHKLVSLLCADIAPRFVNRAGGYTRVMLLERRRGDDAQLAILELTEIKRKAVKEAQPGAEEAEVEATQEQLPVEEKKPKTTPAAVKEKPPIVKKPAKKFLGGLRNILKKERDSL